MNKLKQTFAKVNKIDTFSPYFFLPFILVLYFFTSLFDFHRFELFNLRVSIWPAVFLAVACYYIGVYIIDKLQWTIPSFGLSFFGKYVVHFIVLLTLLGLVSYVLMMISGGGLGISDESNRRNLDPKLNFFAQLLWYGVLLLISYKMILEKNMTWKKTLIYGSMYAAVMFLFLLMGYRTPLIIMLFTGIIIFHYVVKRVKLTWFLTALFVIGVAFSMFGFFRVVSEDTTKEFNSREQPEVALTETEKEQLLSVEQQVNLTPKWIRSLNGESVTGHIVLSKIMEYTQEEGYLKGEIHAGVFNTILPGEQVSPRMRVTEVVNSLSESEGKYITRPNRTTTPTFIGQLFLDGGYLLVAIGFFLYGVLISLIYNKVKQGGIRSFHSVAYAFVITVFTVSMHTGLLDLIFILMLGFVIIASAIIKTDKKKLSY
ncbi:MULTISPECIES: oligosaccharide repeat unit polymerase family protein [unclassified Lysinibacillus]|uniref:oligosaccharide repeat unit polymerase family protein n=1 Tax=unclassified Lysinibacillus TaxID=2636778 RepID=UPI0020122FF1|nr:MULTISPECIES: oligosaccharide repeat unit polymerase family protein [unclassified Lysinibacillus]MCL1695850.1 oligosaccharide repeat unit polymerase family protein [Lysinibacillus sp. BPa_S21]MCL1699904.1 oligosaccharide repeat unit polymerase family protein [Lysinibacillus sp. Bpr_S20]